MFAASPTTSTFSRSASIERRSARARRSSSTMTARSLLLKVISNYQWKSHFQCCASALLPGDHSPLTREEFLQAALDQHPLLVFSFLRLCCRIRHGDLEGIVDNGSPYFQRDASHAG